MAKVGTLTFDTKINTKDFTKQIEDLENKLQELQFEEETLKNAKPYSGQAEDVKKLGVEIEKTKNQLSGLYAQQKKIVDSQGGWGKATEQIEKGSNALSKTIKKVGKYALAVFGIRSAYLAVRSAMSTISQYDDQLAADVDYIKYALAMVLKPVIEWIINAVKSLMYYVGYIAKAWFGVNLWANSSAKGMKKASKSAKDMQKTLAGFDEINVLDSSQSQGGGDTAPSFDMSNMDMPVPEWLQWIADNKDIILGFFETLGVLIVALKLTQLADTLGLLQVLSMPFIQLFGGLALILGGLALTIKGIVDFIKDPSWNNFLTILQGIALVVAGIAVLMGGWVVALVAVGVAIVTWVIQNWDKVKEILGAVGGWIYDNIIKPVADFFSGLWNGLKEGVQTTWDGIMSFIKPIAEWVYNNIIKPVIDFYVKLWNNFKTGIKGAWDFAVGIIKGIANWVNTKIIQPVWKVISTLFSNIKNGFSTLKTFVGNIMNGIWNVIKTPINWIIDGLNTLINGINKISFDVPDWVPGIGGKKLGFDIPKIPKLANGGIVDVPKRGVNIGGAIAGEAGAEAVLPLENPEALDRIGNAIGQRIAFSINFNGDLAQLARILKPQIDRENNRIGSSLILGGRS